MIDFRITPKSIIPPHIYTPKTDFDANIQFNTVSTNTAPSQPMQQKQQKQNQCNSETIRDRHRHTNTQTKTADTTLKSIIKKKQKNPKNQPKKKKKRERERDRERAKNSSQQNTMKPETPTSVTRDTHDTSIPIRTDTAGKRKQTMECRTPADWLRRGTWRTEESAQFSDTA